MDINWRAIRHTDVIAALNIDRTSIHNWTNLGMPKNKDGSYDLGDILRWRVDYVRNHAPSTKAAAANAEGGDNSPELERYRKLKADMTEFDLAVKKKKFMETTVIRAMVRKMAERCRVGFQSIGKRLSIKLAQKNDPKEVEMLIDDEVAKTLKELSTIRLEGLEVEPVVEDVLDEKLELPVETEEEKGA
jgi:phage terminase Nu1 subunit (DNA packaging protein)